LKWIVAWVNYQEDGWDMDGKQGYAVLHGNVNDEFPEWVTRIMTSYEDKQRAVDFAIAQSKETNRQVWYIEGEFNRLF